MGINFIGGENYGYDSDESDGGMEEVMQQTINFYAAQNSSDVHMEFADNNQEVFDESSIHIGDSDSEYEANSDESSDEYETLSDEESDCEDEEMEKSGIELVDDDEFFEKVVGDSDGDESDCEDEEKSGSDESNSEQEVINGIKSNCEDEEITSDDESNDEQEVINNDESNCEDEEISSGDESTGEQEVINGDHLNDESNSEDEEIDDDESNDEDELNSEVEEIEEDDNVDSDDSECENGESFGDESESEDEEEEQMLAALSNEVCHTSWKEGDKPIKLTKKELSGWETIFQSQRPAVALQELVLALESRDGLKSKYTITGKVQKKLISTTNRLIQQAVVNLLKLKTVKNIDNMSISKKFTKYLPLLKQYMKAIIKIYCECGDPKQAYEILDCSIAPFHSVYRGDDNENKQFLSQVVRIWQQGSEEQKKVAVNLLFKVAFRKPVLTDHMLEEMYAIYTREAATNDTPTHLERLNTLTRLYCVDAKLLYLHATTQLRVLGSAVEEARKQPSDENVEAVHSLGFIRRCQLWSGCISGVHTVKAPLKDFGPLEQYLTEILGGALCISASLPYMPALVMWCDVITDHAKASGFYQPAYPSLIRLMKLLNDSKTNPKAESLAASSLQSTEQKTKLSTVELSAVSVATHWAETLVLAALRCLAVRAGSVAFTEEAHYVLQQLHHIKEGVCARGSRRIESVVRKHASVVAQRREEFGLDLANRKRCREFEIAVSGEADFSANFADTASMQPEKKMKPSKKVRRKREKQRKNVNQSGKSIQAK